MFGTLRFVLAYMVAMSHMGIGADFNMGVSSVVVFYIISGYVMTHSFNHNFNGRLNSLHNFYLDRLIRIYPIYLFFMIVTIVFISLTGFGKAHFSVITIASNLLVFPLSYYAFTDSIIVLSAPPIWLVPPAWSLAVELHFYIIIPFLSRYKALKYSLIVISFVIFVFAVFGIIDTDLYGYRMLPGILFIFLTGSLLYSIRSDENRQSIWFVRALLLCSLITVISVSITSHIKAQYTFEVLTGYILGVLIVYILSQVTISKAGGKIDTILGSISYPLFLCHFFTIWIFDYIESQYHIAFETRGKIILQLIASLFISYISYAVIDYPIQRFRKRVQNSAIKNKKHNAGENISSPPA